MLSSIIESIQYPVFIKDNEIKEMQLCCLSNGAPERWTGGFAVVFHFKSIKKDYAFRCLHSSISDDLESRWCNISSFLSSHRCDYLCDFKYNKSGLIVNGIGIPTVKMAWVEGKSLDKFLFDNRQNSAILKKLADNFLKMTKMMHSINFAHGDLQHDNIIVDHEANIIMVDYDSAYVPTMHNFIDIIHGKPNYQHPARFKNKYSSEKLDYFSQLIIYLSLLAYSENPQLISPNIISEESLLFKEQDIKDINYLTHCISYNKIKRLSSTCQSLLAVLEDFLTRNNINELIPFYLHEKFYGYRSLSKYCTYCGCKFISVIDDFCMSCGNKRYNL